MNELNVKIKILRQGVTMPEYATDGSAAIDLRSAAEEEITIAPGERKLVPTGIAISPENKGVVAILCARSGLSTKHGIGLANSVGVIDSDYRGEIIAALINNGKEPYTITKNERIAQLVCMPVALLPIEVCDSLDETQRGAGGFGSTGKE